MQMIHSQLRDQVRERRDQLIRTLDPDDRVDDLLVVGFLVRDVVPLGDQLLDDKCEVLCQIAPQLPAGVFSRRIPAHRNEPVEHHLVPVLHLLRRPFFLFQSGLLPRVVDQRGQLPDVIRRERSPENLRHLLPDCAGSVSQHMRKRLILTMDVRDEMLGSFREVECRGQVDDLRRCPRDRRIEFRQPFQISALHRFHNAFVSFGNSGQCTRRRGLTTGVFRNT